jgi:hypothetical protein
VITPSISGVFETAEPMEIPMNLSVLMTDNANWTLNPYGKTIFI